MCSSPAPDAKESPPASQLIECDAPAATGGNVVSIDPITARVLPSAAHFSRPLTSPPRLHTPGVRVAPLTSFTTDGKALLETAVNGGSGTTTPPSRNGRRVRAHFADELVVLVR